MCPVLEWNQQSPHLVQDGRAVTRTPQGQSVHRPSSDPLPDFIRLDVSKRGAYQINTTMQSLGNYHEDISQHIEGIPRENMARVTNLYCPARLGDSPPILHVHTNNGVIVAVHDDGKRVFCKCTVCHFEPKAGNGVVATVEGTQWVIYTHETFVDLPKRVSEATGMCVYSSLLIYVCVSARCMSNYSVSILQHK